MAARANEPLIWLLGGTVWSLVIGGGLSIAGLMLGGFSAIDQSPDENPYGLGFILIGIGALVATGGIVASTFLARSARQNQHEQE